MPYSLKPGVSFCDVSGRTLFLDLAKDRYFCLSPTAERSFTRLREELALSAEDAANLTELVHRGALAVSDKADALAPCPSVGPATASLLDIAHDASRWRDLGHAAFHLGIAPLRLRVLGLARMIARLERLKRTRPAVCARPRLVAVAGAFARASHLTTRHDQCLPRALAAAEGLLRAGASPDMIIGVKLQPFAAHAWVQCEGMLVNDRFDVVRDFTAIRIV